MQKIITLSLIILFFSFSNSQTIEKGTFYSSISYNTSELNGMMITELQTNANFGAGINTEWTTDITFDGDSEDFFGDEWFDHDEEKNSNSSFGLSANFGSFIIDGVLVGIGLNYGRFNYKNESTYNTSQSVNLNGYITTVNSDLTSTSQSIFSSIAFQPFVRYYIPINVSSIFVGTSFSVGQIKYKDIYTTDYDQPSFNDIYGNAVFEDYSNIEEDDYEEPNPYRFKKLGFEAGLSLSVLKKENLSINFEPSIKLSLNKYKQEREDYYIGYDNILNQSIYEDGDYIVSSNSLQFNTSISINF